MKKTLSLILAVIVLAGFASCSKKNKNTVDETTVAGTTTVETTSSESEETETETKTVFETTAPESNKGVSVHTEAFMNGECSVTLSYPQYADSEHELFNSSMRSYAMQKYNAIGMMPEDDSLYEITSCEVKYESEMFVSAVVTGHIINNTSAHDSYFAYSVNADPRNGRIYMSEELIGDLEQIKSYIADGRFVQASGVNGVLDEITGEDITRSWRSDYGIFPDMYFTNNTFGVLAELPHVLGGYAGFEIPYSDVDGMINDAAKMLCGQSN